MKPLVIIRVYPIDDWIAFNCYSSFKKVLPEADYIFFAQSSEDPPKGSYKWITSVIGAKILIRPYCCNFGGRDHVRACVEGLKMIDLVRYSKVIFSDADIVVHKNPLDEDFEFGGIRSTYNDWHYSGQMLIFDRWLFEEVVWYDHENVFNDFLERGVSISDDTIFSWIALTYCGESDTKNFWNLGYWEHAKLHELEPK